MSARPAQGPRTGRTASRPDATRRDAVRDLLAPVVEGLGLELEDVELRSAGRRQILRVLVDSATGVSLDEVAAASTAVSAALDGVDVLGDEPYTLEVSSPGVDRPLTLPRHWRRNVGRLVAVTLRDGSQVTGRLTSVDDAEAALEVSVKGRTSARTVALADVTRAVVEVEFSRTVDTDGDGLDDLTGEAVDDDSDDDEPTDDVPPTDDGRDGEPTDHVAPTDDGRDGEPTDGGREHDSESHEQRES
jgi:ribosome maturation factor RimP